MEELETRQERDPQPLRQSVLEWAEVVVGSVVVVTLLLTFLCRIITVDGSSMNPTYENGDRVLVTQPGGPCGAGGRGHRGKRPGRAHHQAGGGHPGPGGGLRPRLGRGVTVDGEPLYGETFGIANGITYVPDLPGEVLEFPRPCRKAASLCWGTTGRIPRTAALPRWAWWTAGTFWGKWCSTCSP